MDKLVTFKKFLQDIAEMEEIVSDSRIHKFGFSTKAIREQASQRYIESVERYLDKNIDEKVEAFLRG